MRKNTIDIITLGCSKNLVDSEKLMKLEYETKSDVFVPARRQRDYYEIPANALQYTYH